MPLVAGFALNTLARPRALMRVLMVHDEPIDGGYGAEAYVRRLVGGLRAAGDEVEVVAGERPPSPARARLLDLWDPAARRPGRRIGRSSSAPTSSTSTTSPASCRPSVLGAAPQRAGSDDGP